MNCTDSRDALLVADLRDDSTPLAAHLRECDDCRALAGMLSADLETVRHAVIRRSRSRTRMVLVPIAAAIVGLMMTPAPVEHTPAPVNDAATAVVSVDAGPGQTAAVIGTTDPKVTIVLLSSGN